MRIVHLIARLNDGGPVRVVGQGCVVWYGPTVADAATLRRHLDEDRDLLPEGVTVSVR